MRGTRESWWRYTGSKPLAVGLLAVVCCGGLSREGAALLGTQPFTATETGAPPIGRYVDVSCDSVEEAGRFQNGRPGYMCTLGSRRLPVVGAIGELDDVTPRQFAGRLRELRDADASGRSSTGDVTFVWPNDEIGGADVVTAYLEVQTRVQGLVGCAVAVLAGAGAIILTLRWRLVPWPRLRRASRRDPRATRACGRSGVD